MGRLYRLLLIALILSACIGCDQSTKRIAAERLADAEPILLLRGTVWLHYGENPGAFLGFGSALSAELRRHIFVVMVSLLLLGMLLYVLLNERLRTAEIIALTLVLGGGVSNLLDRFWLGVVRDFVVIGVGRLRTGVFNLADVAITAGGLLWLLATWQRQRAEDGRASSDTHNTMPKESSS